MSNDPERMARAGNYVLGLMNDAERERAERDLERDQSFRDDVLRIAERMRLVGAPAGRNAQPDMKWQAISARISELPQMRGARTGESIALEPLAPAPAASSGRHGFFATPRRRAVLMAAGLIAAFALGYAVGASPIGLY